MFQAKKRLILVDATKIEFQGRDGEMVKKTKYTFLQKDGTLLEAFDDTGSYVKDVKTCSEYDEALAQDFVFSAKLFQGKTTYKLVPKGK